VTVTLAGDLLFSSGKASVKASANDRLRRIARILNDRYAGRAVIVRGHSDSDPIRKSGWRSNQHLSEARAQSVADKLVGYGVARSRIEVVGVANREPLVSPERTRADKAKNRRVEIQVVAGR
jgi:flagellar motor protein MotB